MSISNIQSPQDLTPVKNQVYFTVDSTNKNQPSFRYVFNIYNADTNAFLFTEYVAPEPNFGYGSIDISELLNDYVTSDFSLNNFYQSPNDYIHYRVEVGETYLYSWDFMGVTWSVGDGFYTLTGTTSAIWNLNNQIQIDVSTGDTWTRGLHTVLDTPGNNVVVIGEYGGVTTSTGTVYWANRSKTIKPQSFSFSGYAFNGVKTFRDFLTYDADDYTIIQDSLSTTKRLLTSIPDNFTVTPDQDLWLNLFRGPTSSGQTIQWRIQNSNGDLFFNAAHLNTYTSSVSTFAAGPGNANPLVLVGTTPIVKSDTIYYDLWLNESVADGNTQLSKKYRIYIDQRCKKNDYEILFKDRMGSFVSFAFQLNSQESISIERKDYNKYLGNISTGGWSYNSYDAGQTIYSVNYSEELELSTNWLNDEMSVYFNELLTSSVTLLKDTDGNYYSVRVQDGGSLTPRQNNKHLIRRTVKVRFANQNGINY